jgi:EF-hand domain pair
MIRKIVLFAAIAAMAAPALAQPPGGGSGRPQQTPEERAAAFDKADANKDGSLDATEFKASLGERAANMDADRLKAAFDRRDTDKNGKISKAEYTTPPPPRPAQ